ncbi:parathyroid hormone 4-like [Coregonus clupeaformis]|uniref:parathyroid hormone 4-like n=1 Tax=Coregonus clupeaformis TaxID=59861 RepID=UPI001BDF733B|nr:parathyroid hormone 4-like [Coregonus clupeaformis]
MLVSQKPVQSVAVMVLVVFTVSRCQENERRAVTEHQLLHDRGRTIKSLKRLIWLSSAIEGLDTAQTRSSFLLSPAALNPIQGYTPGLSPALNPHPAGSQSGETSNNHKGSVERLMRNLFDPHLMELSEGEP